MERIYNTYLKIIKNICTSSDHSVSVHPEDLPALAKLAQEHCTVPFVLPYLRSASVYPAMKQQVKGMMLNYYQIEHFTRLTVSLLRKNNIDCYLLKGLSLADCYPVPEYRKLGDLDLYLADPSDLTRAQAILESNGYISEDELNDHHVTYRYIFPKTGRRFLLELHYRVVGQYQYSPANKLVDSVFSPECLKASTQTIHGYTYTVLPPTEYTFYMIHHMLKHYLYSGFGIRLLCDFTFYLKRHEKEINFRQIHEWCRESRISHLYEIILECCRKYLGLPDSIDARTQYNPHDWLNCQPRTMVKLIQICFRNQGRASTYNRHIASLCQLRNNFFSKISHKAQYYQLTLKISIKKEPLISQKSQILRFYVYSISPNCTILA